MKIACWIDARLVSLQICDPAVNQMRNACVLVTSENYWMCFGIFWGLFRVFFYYNFLNILVVTGVEQGKAILRVRVVIDARLP